MSQENVEVVRRGVEGVESAPPWEEALEAAGLSE
jgi:hypothetical protein